MLFTRVHFPNPLLPPLNELLRRVEEDEDLPKPELRLLLDELLDLLTADLVVEDLPLPKAPLRAAPPVRAAMARLDFMSVMAFGAVVRLLALLLLATLLAGLADDGEVL